MTDAPRDPARPVPETGLEAAPGACPPDGVLSAYLDGMLDEAARARLEDHVSRCEDCYFVVKEALLARPARTQAATFQRLAIRYVLPLAAVLVVGLVTAGLWPRGPAGTYAEAVRPLVHAVGPRRFLEARLTGGFDFGPLIGPTRGSQTGTASDRWEVYAAAADLARRRQRAPTAEGERALAAAHLLTGEVEAAIAALERLARERPQDAQVWSDLAAGYLTRARTIGAAADFDKALDAARTAARLAPGMPEALFNEALALEGLGRASEARARWRSLAEQLAGTPWGIEAARRAEDRAQGAARPPPMAVAGPVETGGTGPSLPADPKHLRRAERSDGRPAHFRPA